MRAGHRMGREPADERNVTMGMRERARQRRKRIVTHLATDHEDAERWDLEYWQGKSPQERLSALVAIREDIEKIRRPNC